VLALVLLGVALLLFTLLVGSALSEGPADRGADETLGGGFLVAGAGFLAALAGAIVGPDASRGGIPAVRRRAHRAGSDRVPARRLDGRRPDRVEHALLIDTDLLIELERHGSTPEVERLLGEPDGPHGTRDVYGRAHRRLNPSR